jgi:hypothetical protein
LFPSTASKGDHFCEPLLNTLRNFAINILGNLKS